MHGHWKCVDKGCQYVSGDDVIIRANRILILRADELYWVGRLYTTNTETGEEWWRNCSVQGVSGKAVIEKSSCY
jgi:hypothetical protein